MASWYIIDEFGNAILPGTPVPVTDIIVPVVDNQTSFNLTFNVNPTTKPLVEVNGQAQEWNRDFNFIGNVINWISGDFRISTTDRLNIYYYR